MAHYENADLGVAFDVPDRITVRQQVAFRSRLAAPDDGGIYGRYWNAAPLLLTNWQSAVIPDPATFDLDAADDPRAADIVMWVGDTLAVHLRRRETPDPNS